MKTEFKNIMIIDDSPMNLDVLGSMLTKEGYEVSQFPGGKMAIRAAKKYPPDLILLDIMMPEMDGFETCKHLKSIENVKDVPVIFVSALAEIDQKLKAFQVGGVDYIVKPFYQKEVLERVKTHLNLQKANHLLKKNKANLQKTVYERTRDLNDAQKVSKTGSWKYDVETGYVKWSDMTYDICNLDKSTNPNFDIYFSLIHPKDKDIFLQRWNNVIETGSLKIDHRLKVHQKFKWVRALAKVYKDENGKNRIIGTLQDIDDLKRAKLQNTLFSKVIDQSPAGVVITDTDGTIQFANSAFIQNTGFDKKEIIGAKPSIMNSGYHSETFFKGLWDTILSKNIWKSEIKNRRKDGSMYWDFLIVSPVLDKQGNITHFVGIHENITDRKRVKKKLIESEERYRTIHDKNEAIMYTVCPNDGQILEANPAFFEFYGWPVSSVPGLEISAINPNQSQVNSIIKKVLEHGHYATTVRHKKKCGDTVYMQISTSFIQINGNGVIHVISHDTTQKHTYLKKVLKQNKFMKELVWDQSHEVRAPLTRILSMINLRKLEIEDGDAEFNDQEFLNRLEESAIELDNAIRKMYLNLETNLN